MTFIGPLQNHTFSFLRAALHFDAVEAYIDPLFLLETALQLSKVLGGLGVVEHNEQTQQERQEREMEQGLEEHVGSSSRMKTTETDLCAMAVRLLKLVSHRNRRDTRLSPGLQARLDALSSGGAGVESDGEPEGSEKSARMHEGFLVALNRLTDPACLSSNVNGGKLLSDKYSTQRANRMSLNYENLNLKEIKGTPGERKARSDAGKRKRKVTTTYLEEEEEEEEEGEEEEEEEGLETGGGRKTQKERVSPLSAKKGTPSRKRKASTSKALKLDSSPVPSSTDIDSPVPPLDLDPLDPSESYNEAQLLSQARQISAPLAAATQAMLLRLPNMNAKAGQALSMTPDPMDVTEKEEPTDIHPTDFSSANAMTRESIRCTGVGLERALPYTAGLALQFPADVAACLMAGHELLARRKYVHLYVVE